MDGLKGSYLGTEYSDTDVLMMSRKYNAIYSRFDNDEALLDEVARLIADGAVIGWHQGRMEFGPRALGARSILADARNPLMQKKVNEKVKFRESFRPFAPIIPAEDVSDYFEHSGISPYMLQVKAVKKSRQIPYPDDFQGKSLLDKLYYRRSDIPAVTHIDYTARIQTVHKETNERLWTLLHIYKRYTGCPVMINTSFNVRGEPIVNSPEDAWRCFMRTDLDYLVIGNFIFDKKKQSPWQENGNWEKEFVLD